MKPRALDPPAVRIPSGLLAAAYPLLVFVGLRWLEPRWMAVAIGGVLILRVLIRRRLPSAAERRRAAAPVSLVAGVLGIAFAANDARSLLFVPAMVNAALLFVFARTLRGGTPIVETFARLQHADLTDAEARHCRSFTAVWSGFFALNGAAAFWLALSGEIRLWTIYTGAIAYLLMGLLFAVEFVVRSWRFRRYEGSVVEPLFRRIFPPPPPG